MRIVCFPGAAYDFPLPTNRQQMMRRLAERGHTVLYVEPPRFPFSALVRPRLSPSAIRRWFGRYLATAERLSYGEGALHIHTELNPYPGADSGPLAPTLASLNRRWTARTIAHAPRCPPGEGQSSPTPFAQGAPGPGGPSCPSPDVLWIYAPAALWAARVLPARLVVYDCVDDYAQQPGYHDVAPLERELVARANLVFASTEGLGERLRQINPRTHVLPNVADYDHFASARSGVVVPPELRGLPRPILGYVGALDRYKFDPELVARAAHAYPHASVVLIGPGGLVERAADDDGAMRELQALPNVHLLGPRSYPLLPAYLQCFDVGLIPYQRNAYTAQCSPLKLHEYLAAGLPVAAAGLPAIRSFADIIAYSEDGSDWIEQVGRALAEGRSRVDERQAVARRHTWEIKVDTAERLLMEALNRQ